MQIHTQCIHCLRKKVTISKQTISCDVLSLLIHQSTDVSPFVEVNFHTIFLFLSFCFPNPNSSFALVLFFSQNDSIEFQMEKVLE